MGKWFRQAEEIEKLRNELKQKSAIIQQLRDQLAAVGVAPSVDTFGVTNEERTLVAQGRQIEAIKKYRERTGTDLVTAKNAIDSINQ
ncbi:50S ribosomal protein L7/L12 [Actinotignum sp. GS-2025c]|uniref:50S ribosomal protein L7/L12 n=1 Tax=Actinomycetes TaxID=1760 RepID=UPI003EC7EDB2